MSLCRPQQSVSCYYNWHLPSNADFNLMDFWQPRCRGRVGLFRTSRAALAHLSEALESTWAGCLLTLRPLQALQLMHVCALRSRGWKPSMSQTYTRVHAKVSDLDTWSLTASRHPDKHTSCVIASASGTAAFLLSDFCSSHCAWSRFDTLSQQRFPLVASERSKSHKERSEATNVRARTYKVWCFFLL